MREIGGDGAERNRQRVEVPAGEQVPAQHARRSPARWPPPRRPRRSARRSRARPVPRRPAAAECRASAGRAAGRCGRARPAGRRERANRARGRCSRWRTARRPRRPCWSRRPGPGECRGCRAPAARRCARVPWRRRRRARARCGARRHCWARSSGAAGKQTTAASTSARRDGGASHGRYHDPLRHPTHLRIPTRMCALVRRARMSHRIPRRNGRNDVCDRRGLHRGQGPRLRGRLPGGLHLRGRGPALHPPRRVHRLRRLRAGVSGDGHLPRGGRARRT